VESSFAYFRQSHRPFVHEPLQQSEGSLHTAPPIAQHLLARHWKPAQQSSVVLHVPAGGAHAHVPFVSQLPLQQSEGF
jgi:hypothetical protein